MYLTSITVSCKLLEGYGALRLIHEDGLVPGTCDNKSLSVLRTRRHHTNTCDIARVTSVVGVADKYPAESVNGEP